MRHLKLTRRYKICSMVFKQQGETFIIKKNRGHKVSDFSVVDKKRKKRGLVHGVLFLFYTFQSPKGGINEFEISFGVKQTERMTGRKERKKVSNKPHQCERTAVSAQWNKVPALTPVWCSVSLHCGGCGELTSMPPCIPILTDVAAFVFVCKSVSIHKGFLLLVQCVHNAWVVGIYIYMWSKEPALRRFLRKQALRGSKGRGMWPRWESAV